MIKKSNVPVLTSTQLYTAANIRHLAPIYLYNMLQVFFILTIEIYQDFRHLLIFDLRSNYDQVFIRDSFHVKPETTP
jgi:hypothetical protein